MSRFGLPSFKLLIVGAVAALAYAHHKDALFDPSAEGAAKARPAASAAAPRPAKPVAPQKVTRDKSDAKKPKVASERATRGMEMPRPKPLLTGAIRKEAKPRPPASIPLGAGGQADRKP